MQLARRIEQCLGFECECEAPGDTSRLVTRLADIRIGQVAVGGTCIAFGDNDPITSSNDVLPIVLASSMVSIRVGMAMSP